jgi:hypothetical protein
VDLLGHHLGLVAADGVEAGAQLAVDVGVLEGVEVGDAQLQDTEPGEPVDHRAADAAAARDAHRGVAQRQLPLAGLLVGVPEPAEVALDPAPVDLVVVAARQRVEVPVVL